MKELLEKYFALQEEIFKYFGYVEGWEAIPLDDNTDDCWMLTRGELEYVHSPKPFIEESIETGSEIFSGVVYTTGHFPTGVYRGPEFTMICADTQTDGNKFLMIFANDKECKDKKLIELYEECW